VEFALWEEDSEDEEEWREQEVECTIEKRESQYINEEREGETDKDVGRDEKHLKREEETPAEDVKDKEKFSNGKEESIEERCSMGEEISEEDNSGIEEKYPLEEEERNAKCPFGAKEKENEEFESDEFSMGEERSEEEDFWEAEKFSIWEEEIIFWSDVEEIQEKEEWKEQEENALLGREKANILMRREREKQMKTLEVKRNT